MFVFTKEYIIMEYISEEGNDRHGITMAQEVVL